MSEAVKQVYTNYKSLGIEARAELIKLAKCAKMYAPEQKKLALTFGVGAEAQQLRSLVISLIKGIDQASYKVGKPPAGYMERDLADWLQHMSS